MFRILLKKQMMEIFRAYFYDAKKNKRRSLLSTIVFMVLYVGIMVGILGGMFSYLAIQLCKPFVMAGMGWMYLLLMSSIAIALGTFGSVFNTYSGLYLSKDNDLLLSMPIPVRSILGARLMSVYLLGLIYSAVVSVPAVIVYWIERPVTIGIVAGCVLLVLLISLLVLFLSCVLGWCVAKISQKLKNKSFITVMISLLFFAAYYFVYFKAQGMIRHLLANVVVYGQKVKGNAYPFYLFGRMGEGDAKAMLLFTAVVLVLVLVTFWVLERSFLNIVTAGGRTSRVVYKEKQSKRRSESVALFLKEMARFTSSPNYMLNCGMGSLFLCIAGVALLIRGNALMHALQRIGGGDKMEVMIVVVATLMLCMLAATNDMVVPSVSLEGKNIWIVQSLPVSPWKVLRAKILVQLLVTGVPLLFCNICMMVVLRCSLMEKILVLFVPFCYLIFITLFGMYLGLMMPNLIWTNEIAPIKQSLGVTIAMCGGWAVAIILAGFCYIYCWKLGAAGYLAIITGILLLLSYMLYRWMKGRGVKIFARL